MPGAPAEHEAPSREPDDVKVLDAALKIINQMGDLLEYAPGTAFVCNDPC